jgi:hypothetical protein
MQSNNSKIGLCNWRIKDQAVFHGGVMKRIYFVPLVLAIAFLNSGYTSTAPYCLTDPNRPHIAGAETVLKSYLDAVDRGELRTFGRRLERSELIPVRVEYIYQISSGTMEIKVYSDLKEPVPVPGQPGSKVLGVSSTMDDGKIVETESHIWGE